MLLLFNPLRIALWAMFHGRFFASARHFYVVVEESPALSLVKGEPQGGLEIPCSLVFEGSGDLEEKARNRIKEIMQCILLKKLLPEKRSAGISRDTAESEEPAAAKPTEDIPEEPIAKPTEDLPQEPATEPTEDLSQEPVAKPMKELSQRHQPNVLSDLPSTKLGEQTAQQPQPFDQWLRCQDIVLTYRDRHILTDGELLEDQHLNFAQRLIKMQFPLINGLRLTVLQNQAHTQVCYGRIEAKRGRFVV